MSRQDWSPADQPQFDFGGRSYVSMGHRPSVSYNSPLVVSGSEIHKQTADLATIGVVEDAEAAEEYVLLYPPIPISRGNGPGRSDVDTTPLLRKQDNDFPDLESPAEPHEYLSARNVSRRPRRNVLARVCSYLPAVFLGTLLNVLDALSYGMIMFPIGEAVFSQMAPAGLLMFYISTIVSQLVFSLGGSAFHAGIGSEMIEVTPFFHVMATAISAEMADKPQEAILATVMVTYAFSSVVTGVVFFLLGRLRLGALVGFFPRHILVGCIGGVGYFLVATGLEVSSRLEGGIRYNWATWAYLFGSTTTILEWIVPLALAVILVLMQHKIHNTLLVPVYFMGVFALFHIVVALSPWDLATARAAGWVFPAVENNEPWYAHYKLFRFGIVDWVAILRQLPTMLALTFFGILHVPINVPALAVTVGMDHFDVDRELVAHGYSNVLSGLIGSIQNYLVYTNSVLFIRAGADERIAGVMLAAATACVMFAGPVVIGYIPVCVVGALIYLLGYELLKEALYDTWGRLRRIEYTTIVTIVVVMGAWDFVYGVLAGILLACLSFVVEAARRPVVADVYTGEVARSTVLRHPKQQEFLQNVGSQICVVKLQGTVFFGSIGGAETTIRGRFEHGRFVRNPIKYLVIDMKRVFSIDFSAAEGFRRILNLALEFGTQLVISSVEENGEIVCALRDAGLWSQNDQDIRLFRTLNHALEWCENAFLQTYQHVERKFPERFSAELSPDRYEERSPMSHVVGTPRTAQVFQAASRTAKDEQRMKKQFYTNTERAFRKQPLPLLMITFSGLSDKDEAFWASVTDYFIREKIPENLTFYDTAVHQPSLFLLEAGLVQSLFHFEDGRELHLSILPNTAFGHLLALHGRGAVYTSVSDSIAWRLPALRLTEMQQTPEGLAVYNELLQVQARLLKERFDTLTANLVISA